MSAKVTKDSVNYRKGTAARRCADCTMFTPSRGACSLVAGFISPEMVCDKFDRKGG